MNLAVPSMYVMFHENVLFLSPIYSSDPTWDDFHFFSI